MSPSNDQAEQEQIMAEYFTKNPPKGDSDALAKALADVDSEPEPIQEINDVGRPDRPVVANTDSPLESWEGKTINIPGISKVDAIAPVQLPTRSELMAAIQRGTVLDDADASHIVNIVIAAGFATEDDESMLVDPIEGLRSDPEHWEERLAEERMFSDEDTPPSAAASERELPGEWEDPERKALSSIVWNAMNESDGTTTKEWHRIANAVLAAGFRRQPSVPTAGLTRSQAVDVIRRNGWTSNVLSVIEQLESAGLHFDPEPESEPEPVVEREQGGKLDETNDGE